MQRGNKISLTPDTRVSIGTTETRKQKTVLPKSRRKRTVRIEFYIK